MADINNLLGRIDAEFHAIEEKIKNLQTQQVHEHQERQKRLEKFNQVLDQLRSVLNPRLTALAKRFGDRVKVTPNVQPSRREGTFEFQSKLARIRLRFSASTDRDVNKVVFSQDLEIIPVLTQFEAHAEREFLLDAVDAETLAQWIDDRIVGFVRTYLALHENEYYLKDHMVEDPVAQVRFPKYAAGATLEWKGQTHYFLSDETRREFEKQQGIPSR
jgi:YHS domain-containing protein